MNSISHMSVFHIRLWKLIGMVRSGQNILAVAGNGVYFLRGGFAWLHRLTWCHPGWMSGGRTLELEQRLQPLADLLVVFPLILMVTLLGLTHKATMGM